MAFNLATLLGSNLGDLFKEVIGAFKVDPTVKAQLQAAVDANAAILEQKELDLDSKIQDAVAAQIDVDKQEASSENVFVAGWRPFIGWVCGVGLACQFIVGPLFMWAATLLKHPTPFPTLDLGTLMTLLLGMLGLGGMRTYEKISGTPGSDKVH